MLLKSPSLSVSYSPGGLLFRLGGSNMQHTMAVSFLILVYGRFLNEANREIKCGNVAASPTRLIQFARGQVDYILGSNPLSMSYMVGYGKKFPQKIHHRASTLSSIDQHPDRIDCYGGDSYFQSDNPNPNLSIRAVVGGPDINDSYPDSRADFVHTEPTTYTNAPLVGLLANHILHPSFIKVSFF